jgi:UDP-4-amino-4,6-dideoxy-N-acetyl-beta-L-altrosamine transaminase
LIQSSASILPRSHLLSYARQSISDTDIAAVRSVLESDFLTCGPKVAEFECAFAAKVGAQYAVAVNSATSALHLAMRVADIGPGDRVITSPITFLASANCAAYVGATPDFADIDPVSYNLDAGALKRTWKSDTRAVVAVDYAGQPCEMPAIAKIARENGALLIEDACHGTGGGFFHDGKVWKLGGHPWADMAVFSFHPAKALTSGEGGMLVTDNGQWAERARVLRTHGMVRESTQFVGLADQSGASSSDLIPALEERGPWYYEMQDLGYNYRITDLQCALGLSQLGRLDDFVARRREIVASYNRSFATLQFLKTPQLSIFNSPDLISWHLYTLQIDFPAIGKTRTQVMSGLRNKGVGTQVLYIPIYLQPWYRRTYGYRAGKCPVAEDFYSRALSLPLFPSMSDDDVCKVVREVSALARDLG